MTLYERRAKMTAYLNNLRARQTLS